MEVLLAIVIGVLYAAGIYLMMRRSLVKLIVGLALLGYGANLMIFTLGRLNSTIPPIIPADAKTLTQPYVDPVPQALILTAIVIGFGLQAFVLVLVKRVYERVGTEDLDQMRSTDVETV